MDFISGANVRKTLSHVEQCLFNIKKMLNISDGFVEELVKPEILEFKVI